MRSYVLSTVKYSACKNRRGLYGHIVAMPTFMKHLLLRMEEQSGCLCLELRDESDASRLWFTVSTACVEHVLTGVSSLEPFANESILKANVSDYLY